MSTAISQLSGNPPCRIPANSPTPTCKTQTLECKILTNTFHKTIKKQLTTNQSPFLRPKVSPSKPLECPKKPTFGQPANPSKLNPFQELAAAAFDAIENAMVDKLEKNHGLPKSIDPAVQLQGNYAPVCECPVRHRLKVVGHMPPELRGAYVRNGANPRFPPTAGHHLFDGDGMLHAVTIGGRGEASYSCRYTRTNRLLHEEAMGRAFFPKPIGELHGHLGVARLALFYARAAAGLADIGNGNGAANAGVLYFNGHLLAMSEDDLPYHVCITTDGDLETCRRFDFFGQLRSPMIAHPKLDPTSGELFALSYNVIKSPYLTYFRIDPTGKKSPDVPISLQQPTMIHDFAITENSIVVHDHQVIFKLSEMVRGGSPVVCDREKMSRFGVLPSFTIGMQWTSREFNGLTCRTAFASTFGMHGKRRGPPLVTKKSL